MSGIIGVTVNLMSDVSAFEIALGNEFRAWRNARTYTIRDLAEKSGVGKATIERLENATVSTAVSKTWLLAVALDVPLADIVTRAEQAMRIVDNGAGLEEPEQWLRGWFHKHKDEGPWGVAASYPFRTGKHLRTIDLALLDSRDVPVLLVEIKSNRAGAGSLAQARRYLADAAKALPGEAETKVLLVDGQENQVLNELYTLAGELSLMHTHRMVSELLPTVDEHDLVGLASAAQPPAKNDVEGDIDPGEA